MSEWRKVSDEPPKGTVIIYAYFERRKWQVGLAYLSVSGNWHNTDGGFGAVHATHWMPLPDPPT